MSKVFCIDVAKCNGCYNCQLACKDEHVGNDWAPIRTSPSPRSASFGARSRRTSAARSPKVKIHYISQLCNHCENASCLNACPENAIYRRDDGLVILSTPRPAPAAASVWTPARMTPSFFNKDLNIAQKCTGCAHLLDNGYKLPRCVDACPDGRHHYSAKKRTCRTSLSARRYACPKRATTPRCITATFPANSSPARCTTLSKKRSSSARAVRATIGGKTVEVLSDEYGDFWFKGLAVGKYDVVIEAPGFEYKVFEKVDATKGRQPRRYPPR